MIRRPPNLLVTTPESLYLYLTAERPRATLPAVETVIVDEIHALARDKRGAHLALSLERLQAVTVRPPVRIGLSATVRPVETAARLREMILVTGATGNAGSQERDPRRGPVLVPRRPPDGLYPRDERVRRSRRLRDERRRHG
jgi:ATP-dependent helicase YprA (DUF1998 family)